MEVMSTVSKACAIHHESQHIHAISLVRPSSHAVRSSCKPWRTMFVGALLLAIIRNEEGNVMATATWIASYLAGP